MKQKTDIIIVDDHSIFLDGLALLLGKIKNINVRGVFTNGDEAMDFIKNHDIDLVITDIDMPVMDGIKLSKKIKTINSDLKIIVLTMHSNTEVIAKLMKIGVEGFLFKNTGKTELVNAINTVMDGESYFDNEVKTTYMNSLLNDKKRKQDSIKSRLSKRELEILKLIAEELTTNEIAEKLFISHSTVETHRRNISAKLKVRNTVGLIKFALKNKLIS